MLFYIGIPIIFIILYKIYRTQIRERKPFEVLHVGISGCDTGLGKQLVENLQRENSSVYPGYYLAENSSQKLDVTDDSSVDRFVSTLPENLNVFIHNAGIISSSFAEITDIDKYIQAMNVNYFGVVRLTKKLLPLLRKNKGRMIIVSSITSRLGSAGLSAYGSSKAALNCYVNCLRKEDTGVEVILVEPGMMNTGMIQRCLVELESTLVKLPKSYKISKDKLPFVKWLADHSTSPNRAAQKIIDIVREKRPRLRYLIGADACILDILSYLPYRWSDWLLAR